ncbi:hypothetical protein [Martelella sp. AD-3]|uniref:hypothetical protein n=1 Tax=Martelella sp. AD-3 TaxID=686597 RepID=UPI001267B900|nr:hypothetical protein [Martelella sp. AD-3]
MGDEKPPAAKGTKRLRAFETKEKDQRKQCFSISSVSRFQPANHPSSKLTQSLHKKCSEVGSAIISALTERFQLSALEASGAAKLGREVEQGRQA